MHLLLLAAAHAHHYRVAASAEYTSIFFAALLGWIGVPGAGEVALVAGAILAARGHLDIALVLAAAGAGAAVGGMVGWIIGLKGGRPIVVGRGPFLGARRRAVAAGERVYARHPLLAVYLAPAWMAGLNRMPGRRYAPANLLAALMWTGLIGMGAYLAGRPVADALGDLGPIGLFAVVVIGAAGFAADRVRRRRLA